jgi:hypothetical protein
LAFNGESAGARACRAVRSRCSRTSTAAVWVRCAVSSKAAWARELDVTGVSLGGNKKVNLNFEFITPFPGAGNDRTLRMFGFVDVGNVFGEAQPFGGTRCAPPPASASAGFPRLARCAWRLPTGAQVHLAIESSESNFKSEPLSNEDIRSRPEC